ncbi:MAG: branched-chain amino acid ABC transporter permease [Clostridia bacterium]|jgi:branched-chain amino acid transport system permease protein|nr:branched-chain amino acid ABC transporter permease [Clostridia bacterium]MDH7573091.1 branched-chain amino acid ABC transporter permease [Clostridia bacterium]
MLVTVLDVIVGGILLGGIYALIAVGLSLQYGVARVLNVAHGEYIMLGAFITWALYAGFGVNPLVCLAVCGPLILVVGYFLHRTIYQRLRASSPTVDAFEGSSMLASFGLLYVIQNVAILIWGADIRGYSYLANPVNIGGAVFAANRLVMLAFALGIGIAFYLFLARTRIGKAIRAASQDAAAAGLMGVNIEQVLALCFGLGALLAGVAGTLLSMSYSVYATMGFEYTIIAIIIVALGGLGSIPGSFIGGFLLGIIGTIVTYFEPGLAMVAYYLLFMALLLIRPTGIMGR